MTLLIFLISMKDVVTCVYFFSNQDYIADNLCENKDQPQVMCQGRCYLQKSFKENHKEKHEGLSSTTIQEKSVVYYLPTVTNHVFLQANFLANTKKKAIVHSSSYYAHDYLQDIFHPPSILA